MSDVESPSDELDEWMPFKHAVPEFVRSSSIYVTNALWAVADAYFTRNETLVHFAKVLQPFYRHKAKIYLVH